MNKKVKREIIEWVLFIVIIGGLYLSGYHTTVIGTIQRLVLSTGLLTPDKETEDLKAADYNLRLSDPEGNILDLNQLKGKTIFMNYWATWCPPCIAEMPDINNLYKEVGNDVVFLMISLDEDPQKAIRFANRKEYDFPVYFPASRRPRVFVSSSIPTTYVISPDGKIVVENKGMAKYNTESFKKMLSGL